MRLRKPDETTATPLEPASRKRGTSPTPRATPIEIVTESDSRTLWVDEGHAWIPLQKMAVCDHREFGETHTHRFAHDERIST